MYMYKLYIKIIIYKEQKQKKLKRYLWKTSGIRKRRQHTLLDHTSLFYFR